MDMTRDFIEKLQEMDKPNEIDYSGRKFVDKEMSVLPQESIAEPLDTSTLTSIVDYITSGTDSAALPANSKFVIHISGYGTVDLYQELNSDKRRNHLIHACAEECGFRFGQFMPLEDFNINVQSLFKQDDNTAALLKFIGNVKIDSGVQQEDDGVTQKITANRGISLGISKEVPNPITLKPYRTFTEIEQPESAFVFRLQKDDRLGVTAALFEADGAAWKHKAIQSIKDYLTENLKDQQVIILA